MWQKIIKNTVIHHALAVLSVFFLAYFFASPFVIENAFPQYNTISKYKDIKVCTDIPAGTPSAVFLPLSCDTIDMAKNLACIQSGDRYVTPTRTTDDARFVCPLLVSKNDTTGAKNAGLAALPIDENVLRVLIALAITGSLLTLYTLIRVIVFFIRRPKKQDIEIAHE